MRCEFRQALRFDTEKHIVVHPQFGGRACPWPTCPGLIALCDAQPGRAQRCKRRAPRQHGHVPSRPVEGVANPSPNSACANDCYGGNHKGTISGRSNRWPLYKKRGGSIHAARSDMKLRYNLYLTVLQGNELTKESADGAVSQPWMALFDLDGTLTWRDTLLPFLLGFLGRRPHRALGLWRLPVAMVRYWQDRDRGALKSQVIRMIMGGERRAVIDAWAEAFVDNLKPKRRFRPLALAVVEAHRAAGDRLVLLSASPDLYVPLIGRLLGFERTVCTEVEWRGDRLDGHLKTANRRGEEKLRCMTWLREQYPALPIIAYGNSASDLDHMRHADRALLVNGDDAARRLAAKWDIAVSYWS
jgi:phosphatidylglycerophosphatase C